MIHSKNSVAYIICIVILLLLSFNQNGIDRIITYIGMLLFTMVWAILVESEIITNFRFRTRFKKIGFVNKEKEYPFLVSCESNVEGSFRLCFISEGLTIEDWIDNKHRIENVLNITIFGIYKDDRNDKIIIECMKGLFDYTTTQYWNDEYLNNDDLIRVGQNGVGIICYRFSLLPHVLIGGSSGSGKTVLIKIIIYQCHKKGYKIILADFKGAMDYTKNWRQACNVVTEMDDFYNTLLDLQKELKLRIEVLHESECKDINEYNNSSYEKMQRIILTVDEFADVLGGFDKETKSRDNAIISMITEIARKGRAVGINLIISTQRPDAVVLPSAIKNNLLYRIAGKCDDNLSRIILDSGDAATEIPKNTEGVFLDSNGNLFKGFYAENTDLVI